MYFAPRSVPYRDRPKKIRRAAVEEGKEEKKYIMSDEYRSPFQRVNPGPTVLNTPTNVSSAGPVTYGEQSNPNSADAEYVVNPPSRVMSPRFNTVQVNDDGAAAQQSPDEDMGIQSWTSLASMEENRFSTSDISYGPNISPDERMERNFQKSMD